MEELGRLGGRGRGAGDAKDCGVGGENKCSPTPGLTVGWSWSEDSLNELKGLWNGAGLTAD